MAYSAGMRFLLAAGGLTTLLVLPGLAGPAPERAEGFGAETPGGRGGRRLAVTTLADAGAGGSRGAVEPRGARPMESGVAGLLPLVPPLVAREPFVTIDGSTAPGDGVCI